MGTLADIGETVTVWSIAGDAIAASSRSKPSAKSLWPYARMCIPRSQRCSEYPLNQPGAACARAQGPRCRSTLRSCSGSVKRKGPNGGSCKRVGRAMPPSCRDCDRRQRRGTRNVRRCPYRRRLSRGRGEAEASSPRTKPRVRCPTSALRRELRRAGTPAMCPASTSGGSHRGHG